MATTKQEDFELLSILCQTRRQIEQFRAAVSSAERLENARAIRRTAEEYRRLREHAHISAAIPAEDHVSFSEHASVTKTGSTREAAFTAGQAQPPDKTEGV